MEKNIKIRMARAQDAEALARIYAYYVEKTAITFEHEAPDAAEMETRRKKIFEHSPYLVAEQEGRVLGYVYAHEFYGRAAYAWSVEASIYVASDARGQGGPQALCSFGGRAARDGGAQYQCLHCRAARSR